jgi:hypothetical protein
MPRVLSVSDHLRGLDAARWRIAILVGSVVSLTAAEPEASRRFAEVGHRFHFGR